jgi:hypothetical protein
MNPGGTINQLLDLQNFNKIQSWDEPWTWNQLGRFATMENKILLVSLFCPNVLSGLKLCWWLL